MSCNFEQLKRNIANETEQAITSFECFIFSRWPLESNGELHPLWIFHFQLMYGGGLCGDMKMIYLCTVLHTS